MYRAMPGHRPLGARLRAAGCECRRDPEAVHSVPSLGDTAREEVGGVRRKEGKAYDSVIEALKERGLDTTGVEVDSLTRGSEHLILLNGEVVGEYNHRSKQMFLYSDIVKESE